MANCHQAFVEGDELLYFAYVDMMINIEIFCRDLKIEGHLQRSENIGFGEHGRTVADFLDPVIARRMSGGM